MKELLGLDDESTKMDENQYRVMIDSLLYVTTSMLDIMSSVCICAIFEQEPKEAHLIAVKHIFRYFIGTFNLVLLFKRRESFILKFLWC